MAEPLPKGVSRSDLDRAFKEFAGIVGAKWTSRAEDDRRAYSDHYNAGDPLEFVSGGFVAPESVGEVQAIVKVANRFGVPLWPVSTGKNLAYGGAAPRVSGTVMLDLKRMNRILEVNDELAYAVVEPGVSFFDMFRHLQENGHKLWMSVPGPGWGSLIGNGLERGIGYGYFGDHFDSSCGLEVVLPNGELLRTGMGAMSNNGTWHTSKYGFGPALDGLFTQSNYGVVTKMGRNLLPTPEAFMCCDVSVMRDADLEALVSALRPFKLDETIRNSLVITSLELIAAFRSIRSQWYEGAGPIPSEIFPVMQEKLQTGRWNAAFALYGTETKVSDGWKRIKAAVSGIPGVVAHAQIYHDLEEIKHPAHRAQAGIPSLIEFGLTNWYGSGAHIDFSPVGSFTPGDMRRVYDAIRTRVHEYGFDHMSGFYCDSRIFRCINTLIFNKQDSDQAKKVRQLFSVLISDLAKLGYGEYRTHLAYMDQVASTFDYNNMAMLRLQEAIKDAVDPQGIIAPGKSGVWPRSQRK